MNRKHPKHQTSSLTPLKVSLSDSLSLPEIGALSAGRVLVLVPPDSDYGAAIRRIWELAVATGRSIQLLSLCKNRVEEAGLRRQLVMMSALVGHSGIATEAQVEMGVNWVEVVERNYHTGDIIVCFAEQRAGFLNRPLNQILEENLDVPIVILSGLYLQHRSRLNLLSRISLWTGLISIITGAFFLQIQITSLLRGWDQTTLLIFSVIVEFSLIWGWNHLFS